MRALPLRVTYQDSCHLAHGQKIREAPRKLIRAVPGVEFVEMPLADQCCGSAGVYNVTETKASLELLALKMESMRAKRKRRRSSPRIPAASCNFAPAPRFMAPARKFCTWSSCSTARLQTKLAKPELFSRRRGSGSRADPSRRMHRARGNVAALAHAIRLRLAAHRERHLAVENDVRRQTRVRVVGIERARAILPDESVREAFRFELLPQVRFRFGASRLP